MHILVVNGSPKGQNSITLQTVRFIEKLCKKQTFEILHVGQRIKALEKDFSPAQEALQRADLILFSYPVYTFIAPYQLHRFIELVKEKGISLKGKYATQITTSKHFYDVTAHAYIKENCMDLGLRYIRGLSADMDDLLKTKGQKEARDFFRFVLWSVKNEAYETFSPAMLPASGVEADIPALTTTEKSGDVVIITNMEENDPKLSAMIERFRTVLPRKSRIVNIREYPFKGGCLGCFNCAVSGKCVYKDGFDSFLREDLQTAEAIVYAFTIRDHSMGASFKLYDDRQFCNGHRTVTMGAPVGYLVSGEYSIEKNLQTILEGRAGVGGNYLCGVATDEFDPDREVDRLAGTLAYAVKNKYTQPADFLGVGGMKAECAYS